MIKFILSEIYLGWKHDIKSCFLLIILSTMGFASCGIAFSLTNQTKAQVTEYKEIYEDIQFYTILDNFNNNSIVNLDDKNNTNKFKTFLNLLTESEFFEYFMMYDQPVYIENYIGDESNIYGYEHTSDLSGMTITLIDKNGITRESTGVKAF
ncbi:MAG: hypothetical protein LUG83_03550 [Lachnospiraceae bacterium]|nr:hypothetical protein [Lachnospiraceae bacterium]